MARILTTRDLLAVGGPRASAAICQGIADNQNWLDSYQISQPHRLAHFFAQCGEETDHFHTLTEYASGAAYEGRRDLGNVSAGDGARYRGRGLIQLTGRANYRAFTKWMRSQIASAPDFEASPLLLTSMPWALYAAIWYWMSHDLNRLADDNNIEAITVKINGGLNGYAERVAMYARAALVLIGYHPTNIEGFQAALCPPADGIVGAKTRAALHGQLLGLDIMLAPATPSGAPVVVPDAPAVIRPTPLQPAPTPVPASEPPPVVRSRGFWASLWAWLIS